MTKKTKPMPSSKKPAKKPEAASKAPKAAPAKDTKTAKLEAAPAARPESEEGDEDETQATASGGGEEGLALAAATQPGAQEQSGNLKNFRHQPEMENFYRFIYENDLRYEALAILDEILGEKQARRKLKMEKAVGKH